MEKPNRPPLFKMTEAAATQVSKLLLARDKPSAGVRIGLRTKGCSGLSYTLEYVDDKNPMDETVSEHGVTIYIDPKAVMFLIGTTMDFVEDELQSGFVFNNPNEKDVVVVENLSMSSACWACNALISESVFCDVCGKLQPVLDNSSFARLDIPIFFDVDLKLLEEQYFKAQRLVHPDRFISASKPEKIYSAQHSAAINDAYTTLKDPIKRSQELLKINGHVMANIEQQTLDDPELLMEVIELREELLEVSSKDQLNHLKARIETLLVQNTDAISKAFQSHDYNDAAKLLNRLRYLNKICLEANQRRVA